VVRDSNRSNWIIVVKSGSLKVMKRLRKVEAFEWRKNPAENKAGDFSMIEILLHDHILILCMIVYSYSCMIIHWVKL